MSLAPTLAAHVADEWQSDFFAGAEAAKVFILDALGTGLSGTRQAPVAALLQAARRWGDTPQARVFGQSEPLPADAAALINGYQIHNQEFDCVHERAVVHPMGVILAAVLACAERDGGVSGRDLLAAVVLGVDVAVAIGIIPQAPLTFYRQGMAAAFGASAVLARLQGLDAAGIERAMGIAYSQLSGTMQPHAEGSPLLPLQMGFNARAALTAADLAAAGLPAPRGFLEGRYGYFNLMEAHWDSANVPATIDKPYRVTELSHKPFPTGRATHAAVDGLAKLKQRFGFDSAQVKEILVEAPPLVLQLADRPPRPDMSANYARLCLPYVLATLLSTDAVLVEDFDAAALADRDRLSLAGRVRIRHDGSADENALAPVRVTVNLTGGAAHSEQVAHILGHPDNPLAPDQYLDKFRRCCQSAARPLTEAQVDALIALCAQLDTLPDARALVDAMVG